MAPAPLENGPPLSQLLEHNPARSGVVAVDDECILLLDVVNAAAEHEIPFTFGGQRLDVRL